LTRKAPKCANYPENNVVAATIDARGKLQNDSSKLLQKFRKITERLLTPQPIKPKNLLS